MLDISIIIFAISLIAIVAMLLSQYLSLKKSGLLDKDFEQKDLSYRNFQSFTIRLKNFLLIAMHRIAILLSRFWARLTHAISSVFHNSMRKLEERIIKVERDNGTSGTSNQSIFFTTINAYKHEIKKLKGRIEEETPRPKDS
ncbi:MAG: hypothetical protein IT284_01965 [Bacteroidetes bacterium]|nr:hypothetical protein [Bacteroidota bacterium]